MPSRNKDIPIVALIAVCAIAVRFYGLDWTLPYHFHSDERHMITMAEKIRTAESIVQLPASDSLFFIYPSFLRHLLLLVVAPLFHFVPFSPTDPATTSLYYLIGRGISATFGVASCVLLFVIGRKAYSRAAGFLGAAFLCFAVLHVRDSHFFTTDVALTFFILALVLLSLRIAEGAGTRTWVWGGVVAGLGFATKQTVAIVFPVILLAHAIGSLRGDRGRRALGRTLSSAAFWKRPLLFGIAAAVANLVVNPYPLLAPQAFLAHNENLFGWLSGTIQRNWVFQFTGTTPAYWYTNLLWFGMGPPLLLAGLLGTGWALARRRTADVLLLAFLVLYLGTIGTGFMKFIRYAIPPIPFLALLGARFLVELHDRAGGWLRWCVRAAAAGVLLFSMFLSLAYLNGYRVGDPRVRASRWIHDTIPAGTAVTVENSQTTPLLGSRFTEPDFFDGYIMCLSDDDCVKEDRYVIKVMNMKSYNSRSLLPSERFEEYARERLAGSEYFILGEEFYEQYRRRAGDYPAVAQFYRDLLAGKTAFREFKTFRGRPSLFGLEWNDDGAELSFRMFDHPTVRIFRRVAPEEPAAAPAPGH